MRAGGGEVVAPRRGVVAGALVQVGAHGVEAMVPRDAGIGGERVDEPRARPPGPCTIAAATAWLSATIGLSDIAPQQPVEREDLRPVGRVRARRLVVQRRDRGLDLVAADRPSWRASP